MTNYEKIKEMSIDEMAALLVAFVSVLANPAIVPSVVKRA